MDSIKKESTFVNNYLFIFKVWNPDLKLIKETHAHPVNIYSLAAHENLVFTCSNDGTIQSWDAETLEKKKTLIENPSDEQLRLFATPDGKLYSGDDKGNVSKTRPT